MKTIYKYIFIIFVLLNIVSCEKTITIDLPPLEERIVIQGAIEQNDYSLVFISKNAPYFASVDSAALVKMMVLDAKVYITDGITSEQLSIIFVPYFPFYAYSGDTIKGVVGRNYTLKVEAEGKTYNAITTITEPDYLDSTWFKKEDKRDSLGYIWARYTDDPYTIRYYMGLAKRLHKDNKFIQLFGSIFDGQFMNGQSITVSLSRGIDNLYKEPTQQERDEFGFFKIGDTIILKVCTMDKAHYDFWRIVNKEIYTGNSPFGTPSRVPTNLSGGALGFWGGFGVTYDTIYAK